MFEQDNTTPSPVGGGLIENLEQRGFIRAILALGGGSLRFNELLRATDTNSNTLSHRLRRANDLGLVRRAVIAFNPPHVTYELTPLGHQLRESLERAVSNLPSESSRDGLGQFRPG